MGRPPKKKRGRPKGAKAKTPKALKQKPSRKKSNLPDLIGDKYCIAVLAKDNPIGENYLLCENYNFSKPSAILQPITYETKEEAKEALHRLIDEFEQGKGLEEGELKRKAADNEVENLLSVAVAAPLRHFMAPSYDIDVANGNKIFISLMPKDEAVSLKLAAKHAKRLYETLSENVENALEIERNAFHAEIEALSNAFTAKEKKLKKELSEREADVSSFTKQLSKFL